MGHRIKGQRPSKYRPSATRRPSGLSPIREVNENFAKVWRTLVAHLARSPKRSPKRSPANSPSGKWVQKGRFRVLESPKRSPANSPGVWVRKGRFLVKEPGMRKVGRFLVY